MPASPIPAGYHTVTPYISVKGLPDCLSFLKQAFNAETKRTTLNQQGEIGHAEVLIGNSMVMFAEEVPYQLAAPAALYLYLTDVDAAYAQALQAGAVSIMAPSDQFYGDRNCGVKDAFNITWWLATHVEDLTEAELAERVKNLPEMAH